MEKILVIVEGYGEVSAVPLLLRRILQERFEIYACQIEVHRRRGVCHLRSGAWARLKSYLEVAFLEECPVLWLLDCDDDCALDLARQITAAAQELEIRQPVAFSLLPREYETMFLFDIDASKGVLDLPDDLEAPVSPKDIRGAKGWLSRNIQGSSIYKEAVDQPRITARLNFDLLEERYRDFRHLLSAVDWLSNAEEPGAYPIAMG